MIASEWQWAGGSNATIRPLCRYLAMRSAGGVFTDAANVNARFVPMDKHNLGLSEDDMFEQDGADYANSRRAIRTLCDVVDEDSSLTPHAFHGVLLVCEYDGDWKTSVRLLESFLSSCFGTRGDRNGSEAEQGKTVPEGGW